MEKDDNLTFWMLLLGAIAAAMSSVSIWQRWPYLTSGARTGDALILLSGVLLLAAGAWRSLRRPAPRAASWLAAASGALFSLTMIAGLLLGTIPCSGVG
jgi:hypothetical protein